MKLHGTIKSISHVKSHFLEILIRISDSHAIYVITQNGEAKAVIQDIEEYDKMQESLSMLKLIAHGKKDIEDGKVKSVSDSFKEIRKAIS